MIMTMLGTGITKLRHSSMTSSVDNLGVFGRALPNLALIDGYLGDKCLISLSRK